jgi:hypothetical protein
MRDLIRVVSNGTEHGDEATQRDRENKYLHAQTFDVGYADAQKLLPRLSVPHTDLTDASGGKQFRVSTMTATC